MKELKQIYDSLLPAETGYLKEYYGLKGKRRRAQLLSLLGKDPLPDNSQASKLIYQEGEAASAFTHLKERVRQDMLILLMLQDTERHSKSAYRQAEIECRKLIIEGDILLKKGIYTPAIKALDKSVKLSTTFELVNEKLMAEDLMRTHLGFREGPKRYNAFDESIAQSYQLLGDMLEVKQLYYRVLLPNLFSPNLTSEYIVQCKAAYDRMQALYERSKSANIAYYMYLTGVYYYTFINSWALAVTQAQQLLKIVEQEPAISSYLRIANAQLQTASILTKLYSFEKAATHAQVAVDIFKGGAMNELVSLEQLYIAAFNAKQTEVYQYALEKALNHTKIRSSDMLYGKWLFYKAAAYFTEGNLEKALESLNADNTLLKDKSGWLFGHRLLEIMILMERKDYDLIDFRIEALRKLLQRQKHKAIARIKTIFQILYTFVKEGYNYQSTLDEIQNQLALLEGNAEQYFWDPLGFEVVRFDTWFKAKCTAKR